MRKLAFDASPSVRSVDENGFLHIAFSHLTKAAVNPYYGREIPGREAAGLDPDAVYYGLRDPDELQKSLRTWEGLPLHIEHHFDSADKPGKLTRVGAVGTGAVWNAPYVDAPLTVWDRAAIEAVEDGSFRELSCAYRYDPDFTPGRYEGVAYDFVMRNIRGNHVALVEEGRAGPDVLVADAAPPTLFTGAAMQQTRFTNALDPEDAPDGGDGERPDREAPRKAACRPDDDKAAARARNGGEAPADQDKPDRKEAAPNAPAPDAPAPDDASGKKPAPKADDALDLADRVLELTPEQRERLKAVLRALLFDTTDDNAAERPLTAADAALIQARAVAAAQDAMRAVARAVADVRPLVGDLDLSAFDSAADVYGYALEQSGVEARAYPRAAWRGMTDMLRSRKAGLPSGPRPDREAPARPDGVFAGLNAITIADRRRP